MNTEGILMPKNHLKKKTWICWLSFLHYMVGCSPFWLYRKNKNNKKYLRACRFCSSKERRINGRWV